MSQSADLDDVRQTGSHESTAQAGTADSLDLAEPSAGIAAEWNGKGHAPGHHGEILQGAFRDGDRLARGLTTMPCDRFVAHATVWLRPTEQPLVVEPPWKTKALRAARLTIARASRRPIGGRLLVSGNVDVGLGFGSSSSDVLAAIRAVLDALGASLRDDAVARLAVQSEVASDPLMFDRMVLFAQREGRVIEDFGVAMCPVEGLGFPLGIEPVDTLAFAPARYDDAEIAALADLRALLRTALHRRDARALGRVATGSAIINQRFLPVPKFDEFIGVSAEVGAAGIQIAHSGSVGSLLFDPSTPSLGRRIDQAAQRLRALGVPETWRLRSTAHRPAPSSDRWSAHRTADRG